jgi:hypothetical protein
VSRERDRAARGRAPRVAAGDVVSGRRAVAEALRARQVSEVLVVSSPKVTQGFRAMLDAAND